MKIHFQILLLFILCSLLASCAGTRPPTVVTPYTTSTIAPTQTNSPTRTLIPTRTRTPMPTLTLSPTPTAYPLLAGLRYQTEQGQYRIDAKGISQFLSNSPSVWLSPKGDFMVTTDWGDELYLEKIGRQGKTNLTKSPDKPSKCYGWTEDGTWILYTEGSMSGKADLFKVNPESGERVQLTQSPNRSEYFVQMWPGRPEQALISVVDETFQPGPTFGQPGTLYLLHLDSGQQVRIGTENEFTRPAFQPGLSGQPPDRFIFQEGGQSYFYSIEGVLQPFQILPVRDMPGEGPPEFAVPVWSPDGRWLAGSTVYQGKTGWAVVDWKANTTRLFHLFTHVGMGGHYDEARFSPDSRWLILNGLHAEEREMRGIWFYSLDGVDTGHFDGNDFLISPDGKHLLITNRSTNPMTFTLITYGTWDSQKIELPGATGVVDWQYIME